MKKLIVCVLTLFVLVPVAPFAASADSYVTNTTQVLPYQGVKESKYTGYTTWMDNIPGGDGSLFNISGYEIGTSGTNGDVVLNIFTNMPPGGDPDTSIPTALQPLSVGNMFLNLGGLGFTQAFVVPDTLGTSNVTLLNITGATTSKDLWSPYGRWVYGGEYRQSPSSASSGNVPVIATGGTETNVYAGWDPLSPFTGNITATWIANPTTHPGTYELSILFPGLDGNNANDIVFLWASGTCANGVIFGSHESPVSPPGVPVPPSALLLGTGLLGLGVLRYRRKVT